MATSPEQETQATQNTPDVKEIPEVPEISEQSERQGVTTATTQVTAQVTDDQGQQLIQTPSNQTVSITIPADQNQIHDWSKGSPDDAITWLGVFWWRMIQKALHFGWKIFKREGGQSASN